MDSSFEDGGLAPLRDLARLRYLRLSGSEVTDTLLQSLHGLRGLAKLQLIDTKVTEAGVESLKKTVSAPADRAAP